ncbi:hypothetical protein AMECASPLE_012237 [Ameca splendens]|uniref:Uncharacterized protein n=1 Tax=Ameca splendens TaxID=208324 RepID=A0ABV0XE42_9TELE
MVGLAAFQRQWQISLKKWRQLDISPEIINSIIARDPMPPNTPPFEVADADKNPQQDGECGEPRPRKLIPHHVRHTYGETWISYEWTSLTFSKILVVAADHSLGL